LGALQLFLDARIEGGEGDFRHVKKKGAEPNTVPAKPVNPVKKDSLWKTAKAARSFLNGINKGRNFSKISPQAGMRIAEKHSPVFQTAFRWFRPEIRRLLRPSRLCVKPEIPQAAVSMAPMYSTGPVWVARKSGAISTDKVPPGM
jgi:hypothetical protein